MACKQGGGLEEVQEGGLQVEYNTVHMKLAGYGQKIFKMSGEELLFNSIKCLPKNFKHPVKPKFFLFTL